MAGTLNTSKSQRTFRKERDTNAYDAHARRSWPSAKRRAGTKGQRRSVTMTLRQALVKGRHDIDVDPRYVNGTLPGRQAMRIA